MLNTNWLRQVRHDHADHVSCVRCSALTAHLRPITLNDLEPTTFPSDQGPRSNFEIGGGGGGGGTISDSILGGHKTLFLINSL